ncbi:hypothetical protein EUGRSUZ_E00929 [Eucalyptus grandis]|uniref:Uncharacterized protein n=2 Tax=Eucalyptus grandis TaxID=71139 RepID=A0ACC3KTL8_EUCGR|nr:hypothetical protein EUGRSUZ_E00929 [Eucalyptus grandis]
MQSSREHREEEEEERIRCFSKRRWMGEASEEIRAVACRGVRRQSSLEAAALERGGKERRSDHFHSAGRVFDEMRMWSRNSGTLIGNGRVPFGLCN